MDPVIAENLARRADAVPISATRPETLTRLLKELEKRLWPGEALEQKTN